MTKIVLGIIVVVVIGAVLVFAFGLGRINLELARYYYKTGDLGKAIEFYGKALERMPDNVIANKELGLIYYKTNKYENGCENLAKVVEVAPEESEVFTPLGICYYNFGEMDKAGEWLRKGCDVDNKDRYLALTYYGMTLRRQRNLSEAVGYLEEAVEIEGEYEPAVRELALAYWETGEPEKAGELAGQVVAVSGEDIRMWWLLAESSLQKGDIEAAKSAFESVIELEPEDLDAVWNLALAYKETGEPEKATVLFEKVVERKPNDMERIYMGALLELELDNIDKAKDYAEKTRELVPDSLESHRLWLEIYRREAIKDNTLNQNVVEEAKAVLAVVPADIDAMILLGQAEINLGNFPDAIAAFETALNSISDERTVMLRKLLQEAHFAWGESAYNAGDKETAIREFQEAIDTDPTALNLVERAKAKIAELTVPPVETIVEDELRGEVLEAESA